MRTDGDPAKDYFQGRRVLVIGGHGFLGRNAVLALTRLGAVVTVLARQTTLRPAQARTAPRPGLIIGDMREFGVAREAVRDQEVVLNFAGVTSAVTSNRAPTISLMEECFPHLNLLAACAEQTRSPLVIFPSSRLVYGRPDYLPVDENHPTRPNNVYGVHKLTVENYLRVYAHNAGVPHLIFRISNPYGPLQARDNGYGILNTFIQRAVAGQPIRLFGDGGQRRDFVYVDDLLDMMLRAIATPACHNQTFNLGGPEAIPLRLAAEEIAAAAGGSVEHVPWPAEHLRVETGDYLGSLAALGRLITLPDFTDFRAGIRATVQAYRAYHAAGASRAQAVGSAAPQAPATRQQPPNASH